MWFMIYGEQDKRTVKLCGKWNMLIGNGLHNIWCLITTINGPYLKRMINCWSSGLCYSLPNPKLARHQQYDGILEPLAFKCLPSIRIKPVTLASWIKVSHSYGWYIAVFVSPIINIWALHKLGYRAMSTQGLLTYQSTL